LSTRIVGIFALTIVASCGGSGSGGSAGGSGGAPSKYLYADATYGPNTFPAFTYGFVVNPGPTLSPIPGFTRISEGQYGGAPLVVTPDSKLFYAGVGDPFGGISAYLINPDGTLTAAPSPSFSPADGAVGLVMHPTANFLYASSIVGDLYVLAIDPTTGALKLTSSVTLVDSNPVVSNSAVITPDGRYLYQSYAYPYGSSQPNLLLRVAGFSIDASTGVLSAVPGSPAATSLSAEDSAGPMVIDPTGKFLYVGYLTAGLGGEVDAYLIDGTTGALSSIPGAPFSVGDGVGPGSMAIDSSGKFLIVTLNQSVPTPGNCLVVLAIKAGTGTLTSVPGSPFAPATFCGPVVADPSEPTIYVGTGGELTGPTTINVLSVNETNGALSAVSQIAFPDNDLVGTSYMVLTH
jgi:6-phosphogluconolactonase (cycloisomerase 2 family)